MLLVELLMMVYIICCIHRWILYHQYSSLLLFDVILLCLSIADALRYHSVELYLLLPMDQELLFLFSVSVPQLLLLMLLLLLLPMMMMMMMIYVNEYDFPSWLSFCGIPKSNFFRINWFHRCIKLTSPDRLLKFHFWSHPQCSPSPYSSFLDDDTLMTPKKKEIRI